MAHLQIFMLFLLLCFIKVSVEAPVAADNAAPPMNAKKEVDIQNVPMEGSYKVNAKDTEAKPEKENIVKEVVISEKPFISKNQGTKEAVQNVQVENIQSAKDSVKIEEKKNENESKSKPNETNVNKTEDDVKKGNLSQQKESVKENSVLSHEESVLYRSKVKPFSMYSEDLDIPDSYKVGSYFLLALSGAAISFIVFKIYRMRLTRAERKYGVQGNRATQELTPLPMAIDDLGNSDDEDQTLFDRHQIRIL